MLAVGWFDKKASAQEAQREVDRLSGLDLVDLAAEILALLPEIDIDPHERAPSAGQIATAVVGGNLPTHQSIEATFVVAEALQLLEHARLVRVETRPHGSHHPLIFRMTRAGHQATVDGDVAEIVAERTR